MWYEDLRCQSSWTIKVRLIVAVKDTSDPGHFTISAPVWHIPCAFQNDADCLFVTVRRNTARAAPANSMKLCSRLLFTNPNTIHKRTSDTWTWHRLLRSPAVLFSHKGNALTIYRACALTEFYCVHSTPYTQSQIKKGKRTRRWRLVVVASSILAFAAS